VLLPVWLANKHEGERTV